MAQVFDPSVGSRVVEHRSAPIIGDHSRELFGGTGTVCVDDTVDRFWSVDGNSNIREWSISGGAVTGGNLVLQTPQGTGSYALAIADLDGQHRFYTGSNPADSLIYEYQDGSWVPLPMAGHGLNMGGSIGHIFFTDGNYTFLYHFDGTNVNQITMAPPSALTGADVAVDPSGNAYMLIGSAFPMTTVIQVYSPAGSLLTTYPVSFDSNNAYGTFLHENTLYVGLGPNNPVHPNVLLPISLDGGTAVIGTPIPFNGDDMRDLANCVGDDVDGIESTAIGNQALFFHPQPANSEARCMLGINERVSDVRVQDALGRTVPCAWKFEPGTGALTLQTAHLVNGRYALLIVSDHGPLSHASLLVDHGN